MQYSKVSNDKMSERIIRFEELQKHPIPLMFIDSVLEGHQRLNFAVIGDNASENPEFEPMLKAPHTFQIGMIYALPGNGAAYHAHDYVEVFMPLIGQSRFYWRNNCEGDSEGEAILGQFDLISFPPGLFHGFEVVGDEPGWIFAVLDEHQSFASQDPYWSEQVVKAAAEKGLKVDEKGKMILPANYAQLRQDLLTKIAQHLKQ